MLTVIVPGWGYCGYFWGGTFSRCSIFFHFVYMFCFCKQKEQNWLFFLKLPGPSTVWDHCCPLPSSKADNQGLPKRVTPFRTGPKEKQLPNLAYLINSWKFFQPSKGVVGKGEDQHPIFKWWCELTGTKGKKRYTPFQVLCKLDTPWLSENSGSELTPGFLPGFLGLTELSWEERREGKE